ncbi:hypothetical protein LQ567_20105 [Niabella pedocola]|uniref:Beta-lactamase-inhibitor-like PepSY-like domain-containing protein n=1 Tax=Niabella pedocola TaxID=1752077 RepID=A0ABS8PVK3_9BACT|nr:hypothetical protein [Niabella pedocola]MCD2425100.1 hypothetical protein [Niabella pedocola]
MYWKLFVLSFAILSCSGRSEVINTNDAESITVSSNNEFDSSAKYITTKDSIKSILNQLNKAYPTPIKFYATHRLEVLYRNGLRVLVLCNAKSMKVEGRTYRMSRDISDILQ